MNCDKYRAGLGKCKFFDNWANIFPFNSKVENSFEDSLGLFDRIILYNIVSNPAQHES